MTDLVIRQGDTFTRVIRRGELPYVFTPITAVSKSAPAVITAAGHGLADGWRAAIVSAGGMRQINAKPYMRGEVSTIPSSDFRRVTYVSPTQVAFNDIDSTGFSTYTSGGSLVSYTPMSLAGASARMQIRSTAESSTTLLSLVSPTDIVLDDSAHTITVVISATATAAFDWDTGVYDLEIVEAGDVVTKIMSGNITVVSEVTR